MAQGQGRHHHSAPRRKVRAFGISNADIFALPTERREGTRIGLVESGTLESRHTYGSRAAIHCQT